MHSTIGQALEFAVVAHGDQTRKGTAIPYVSHLLQVSGLVLEWGGDLEQATAALLHDVVEDTARTLAEVEAAFGPGVAAIVADCTDTEPDEAPTRKRPWLDRKRGYIEKLRSVGLRSALVIACDKLHNISTLLADLGRDGVATLSRFNAPAPKQLWYFRAVAAALAGRVPAGLHAELAAHAERFAALTGAVEWGSRSTKLGIEVPMIITTRTEAHSPVLHLTVRTSVSRRVDLDLTYPSPDAADEAAHRLHGRWKWCEGEAALLNAVRASLTDVDLPAILAPLRSTR